MPQPVPVLALLAAERVLLDVPAVVVASRPGGDATEVALIGHGGGAHLARLLVYLSEATALHFPTRGTDLDRRRFRLLIIEEDAA